MTETKQKYLEIASNHTEQELSNILGVHPRTIRRYAEQTGIKPMATKYQNHDAAWYENKFNNIYQGKLRIISELIRDKRGHFKATCECQKCKTTWQADIHEKVRTKTGCMSCDKGRHGNNYDQATVESMLNAQYKNQWKLLEYKNYSKPTSTIQCTLCGHIKTNVQLSGFMLSTKRCTNCQTGSFGEYVIANTLAYNNIRFEREVIIQTNGHTYRLDFLIEQKIALEYSGEQHFTPGRYFNEAINAGVIAKKQWSTQKGYTFVEMRAKRYLYEIIDELSTIIGKQLSTPTAEYFKMNNPDMRAVLDYMKTHSARCTMKHFNIPSTKLQKYVKLAGYKSISDWQSDNKAKSI